MSQYVPLAQQQPDPGYYWTLRIVGEWVEHSVMGDITHYSYLSEWRRWDGERWSGDGDLPSHWYREEVRG